MKKLLDMIHFLKGDPNASKEQLRRYVEVEAREGLRSISMEVSVGGSPRLDWGWQPRYFEEAVRQERRRVRVGGVPGFQLGCTFNYPYLPPYDYGNRVLSEVRFWRTTDHRDRRILHFYDETQKALNGILTETDLSYEQVVGPWFPSYMVYVWELHGVVVVHDISDFRHTLLDRIRIRRMFTPKLEARHRKRDRDFIRLADCEGAQLAGSKSAAISRVCPASIA